MKKIILLVSCICFGMIIGCKAPDILAPKSPILRTMAALRQGQTIEWDETITDTVTPPSSFADSSSDFKTLCINKQVQTCHVTVSIPDSTVPQFSIERHITSYSQRDTMGGQRISKVVTYGNNFTTYDQDGATIGTTTMTGAGDSAQVLTDWSFFEYRPDTTVTTFQRGQFVSTMTSMGGTVTNLGSDGYKVEMTFADGANSWTSDAYFDHDYLTLTRMTSSGMGTATDIVYSYTVVSGYLINTTRVTTSTTTPTTYWASTFSTNAPNVNSDVYAAPTVTTMNITNISLP